jgi:hypothetical protein
MESAFATPREEPVHGDDDAARGEAGAGASEFIEVSSDRRRRHSAPGCRSPTEDECAG